MNATNDLGGKEGNLNVSIREITAQDFAAVRRLLISAFTGPGEADLVERMRARGETILELVAETDGRVVGFLSLCALRSPRNCVGLAPVAVIPELQRRGIGSALIEWAIRDAKSNGVAGIFLVGDPNYYSRFGFSVPAASGFESAYPPEATQLLILSAAELGDPRGQLTYASSFDDFD